MAAPVQPSSENPGLVNLQALMAKLPPERPNSRKKIPIVLVPGFSCWGDPFFGTINYFGGFNDLPGVLVQQNYAVILVRPGPLSTNWERACEIYAQLRSIGGQGGADNIDDVPSKFCIEVDYGNRVGYGPNGANFFADNNTSYPKQKRATCPRALVQGLEDGWTWSAANPVHFICHSQGGTTVRTLIELFTGRHGNAHPHFAIPRQNWIKSVVTLGTPHRGSTIIDVIKNLFPNQNDLLDLLGRAITSASFKTPSMRFYDLQLDHWGFKRIGNESFQDMYDRIEPVVQNWWNSHQNGFDDNSLVGSVLLDGFEANRQPTGIFYFTMSFDATRDFPPISIDRNDLKLFPLRLDIPGLPNPLDWFAAASSHLPPILFGGVALAKWIIDVANNHLGQLGYFNRLPAPGARIPRPDMLPVLAFTGYAMGGRNIPDDNWLNNDGIVNTISMQGPTGANIRDSARFPQLAAGAKDVYWHFGVNQTMDHADQIGVFTDNQTYQQIETMYRLFGELLTRLP